MFIDFILDEFSKSKSEDAMVWNDQTFKYEVLLKKVKDCIHRIEAEKIPAGSVVGLDGDFSPNGAALFLALVEKQMIVVPQSNQIQSGREKKDDIAQVEYYWRLDDQDQISFEKTGRVASHALYTELKKRKHPGLLLFSSGTSGDPKAAVHDFTFLLEKFKTKRKTLRTLNFLLFDHWGGLNTMLHTLSNGGAIITVRERAPNDVCRLIEKHKVELLPATPTFLNLLLISGADKKFDLGSLKVVTYGAEPMPASTLTRLQTTFPNLKLQQTYGLIEVGVLRSQSRDDGSLWVKIGGEGYQTRVVENILHIKTASTILGYLNAPTPITEDGWFITGDAVEVDGDYFKILGRKSEMINVGGEKVYPAEIESVIQAMDQVAEVRVYAEKNPIMGNLICAEIRPTEPVDKNEFVTSVKKFCLSKLEKYKVPVKIKLIEHELHGDRFKKKRESAKDT